MTTVNLPPVGRVDIYPVGVLKALQVLARSIRHGHLDHGLYAVRSEARYLTRQSRARNWRAVRNAWNGYLAEPYDSPVTWHRCGRGWTHRAALRSLRRRVAEAAR